MGRPYALTTEEIAMARRSFRDGELTRKELAECMEVSLGTINQATKGMHGPKLVRMGRPPKLSTTDIEAMRKQLSMGAVSRRELATQYGVGYQTVVNATKGIDVAYNRRNPGRFRGTGLPDTCDSSCIDPDTGLCPIHQEN